MDNATQNEVGTANLDITCKFANTFKIYCSLLSCKLMQFGK